jgi:hypothetical protein
MSRIGSKALFLHKASPSDSMDKNDIRIITTMERLVFPEAAQE